MQPYERATEELLAGKRQGAQTALAIGGLGAKGSAILQGLKTFTTPGVAAGVATSGISKLSPFLKKFVNFAKKYGYDDQEIVDHIRDNNEQSGKKSLFERLLGNVEPSSLDEGIQKQLRFLAPIAEQLESKGKDEKDPAVKKLMRKIKQILGGKQGALEKQAMEADLGSIAERMAPMVNQAGQGQPAPQPAPQGQPVDQSGQQQMGPGAQALMGILQKIQAARGNGG